MKRLQKECKEGDILMIQWLENSIFYMLNGETGCMELPKRDEEDGILHVTGRVTVSKDMQLEKLDPVLAWSPDSLKVLLCPLVSYLVDCCAAHQRGEQIRNEDGTRQLKEPYQLRRAIKSRIIQKKYRNIIIMDPLAFLGAAASLEKAKTIMADCYHLHGRAREVLATKVKEEIEGWLRGKKRSSDTAAGADSKRQRMKNTSKAEVESGHSEGNKGGSGASGGKGRGKGRGGRKPAK